MTTPAAPHEDPNALMRSIIQRIATGPELSKDISQAEARGGMKAVLSGKIDPVQVGIFLIALRMKRETMEENKGLLSGIKDSSDIVTADVDEVLDIADPYDGYNRTLPASPFLPAVLAACGVPTVTHGMETVSPKFGVTHKQILRAAGIQVDLTPAEVAQRLSDAATGWGYVDQAQFCPALHDLSDFRSLMIKRSAVTTVEVVIGPIRGQQKTHLMTGYVHKPYPPIYAELARHSGFTTSMLVRGVEGGVIPSLRQAGKFFRYNAQGEESSLEFDPQAELGIAQEYRAAPLPAQLTEAGDVGTEMRKGENQAVAETAVAAGLAALKGEAGATRDGLIYSGAMCLWNLGKVASIQAGAERVKQVLDDGSALARFESAKP